MAKRKKRRPKKLIMPEIDGVKLGAGLHLIIGTSDIEVCNVSARVFSGVDLVQREYERLILRFGHDWHYNDIANQMDRLRKIPGQWFLATMNPSVMDRFYFRSPLDFRRHVFVVKNRLLTSVSRDVAEDFYQSYMVGFQQVSELLRVKGLW
jgi:hypothetical protein